MKVGSQIRGNLPFMGIIKEGTNFLDTQNHPSSSSFIKGGPCHFFL